MPPPRFAPDPCRPQPERCVTGPREQFAPGISTRHSPICENNVCYLEWCGSGNWRVASGGTLDRTRWLEGWIYTQLTNRGAVECDEHPLGERGGGWWFDAFRDDGFKTGSKLWSVNWMRVNPETLMVVKQYAQEALAPLISWGIASAISVSTAWISVRPAVIHLSVNVKGPGISTSVNIQGSPMPDSTYLWAEYKANPLASRAA